MMTTVDKETNKETTKTEIFDFLRQNTSSLPYFRGSAIFEFKNELTFKFYSENVINEDQIEEFFFNVKYELNKNIGNIIIRKSNQEIEYFVQIYVPNLGMTRIPFRKNNYSLFEFYSDLLKAMKSLKKS